MIRFLKEYLAHAYLSYKGLFLWLNAQGLAINVCARPMLFVVTFVLVGQFISQKEDIAAAFAIGAATYSIATIVVGGLIQSFYYEYAFGTLPFVMLASRSAVFTYLSRPLWHSMNGIMAFVVSFAVAWPYANIDFAKAEWLMAAAAVGSIVLSVSMFGLALGPLTIVLKEWSGLMQGALGLLLLATGVIIPFDEIPGPLAWLGRLLPITNGLESLRQSLDGAEHAVIAGIVIELGIAMTYLVIGLVIYGMVLRWIRTGGQSEL